MFKVLADKLISGFWTDKGQTWFRVCGCSVSSEMPLQHSHVLFRHLYHSQINDILKARNLKLILNVNFVWNYQQMRLPWWPSYQFSECVFLTVPSICMLKQGNDLTQVHVIKRAWTLNPSILSIELSCLLPSRPLTRMEGDVWQPNSQFRNQSQLDAPYCGLPRLTAVKCSRMLWQVFDVDVLTFVVLWTGYINDIQKTLQEDGWNSLQGTKQGCLYFACNCRVCTSVYRNWIK
jgi:hypothetical protein